MVTVIRAAVLAAALSLAATLPAAAQQASPGAAPGTPPAVEPTVPGAAPPSPSGETKAPDLEAMVQKLQQDLQDLTQSAQQGVRDIVNRESPYVIPTDQLVAVAAGAVVGALVIDFLGGGGLATLTGAAIGGVAGHWMYTNPEQLKVPAMPGRGG